MKFHLNRKSRERIEGFDSLREQAGAEAEKQKAEPLSFAVCGLTDVGKVRRTNQDSLVMEDSLAGVADGMGGHLGGETASSLCRDTLCAFLRGKTPDKETLVQGVNRANAAVFERSESDSSVRGMGTTLCVMWIGKERLYVAHVGDSRCYRFAAGELTQVTKDHSMVMEMVRAGIIKREDAASHPMRNVITRAVGTDPEVDADILDFPLVKDDLWLLCSDGLHGMVSDEDMAAILAGEGDIEEKARKLLDAALEGGGHDNVSVVLVSVTGGEAAK